MFKSIFTILPLLSAIFVSAEVNPTSPDGSTVVKVGQTAEAMWSKDTQGNWTDVTVKLMTGDNFNMVEVTTLAENVDGTTATSLEWTVPDVSPNSKIYFLQFTPDNTTTPQWTTRFTIAAADGTTTEPTNSTQPGTGAAIPWGTGMLVSGGNSTTSSSTSSNSTTAESSSASSTSKVSSSMMSSSSAQASMTTSVRAAAASSGASSVASAVSSGASAAAASATPTSGATSVQVAGGLVAIVGFVAGFMVL